MGRGHRDGGRRKTASNPKHLPSGCSCDARGTLGGGADCQQVSECGQGSGLCLMGSGRWLGGMVAGGQDSGQLYRPSPGERLSPHRAVANASARPMCAARRVPPARTASLGWTPPTTLVATVSD